MHKKEIEKFIDRVLKIEKKDPLVCIEFVPNKKLKGDPAQIAIDKIENKDVYYLYLNRKYFSARNKLALCQSIILHELSHGFTSKGKPSGKNEYLAHKKAFDLARKLHRLDCMLELRSYIMEWKYCTKKKDKIYKDAYNLAKKNNFEDFQ
jgi:hypothetical protein